jgi:hypothetical protein
MAVPGLVVPAVSSVAAMRMIGAAHRLERLDDLTDLGTETSQHVPDYVIALDQDAVRLDLRSEVPVAQMPRELDQMQRTERPDRKKPFLRSLDLDRRPILQNQSVAVMEKHRLLQVEHDHLAIVEMQELPPEMAPVMGEDHNPFRCILNGTRWFERGRALHEISNMAVF